ncbi:hypothetical protein XELAEV_18019774mg [Xenopus laevis]|uniref:Uncharacterized protein n=1 Tax=Xenopus laevis TaxID=8355 RepID=A0A974D7H8_XENLA|nr:hypothetical protein XELAEV_18019774mg [Xenopus laevis]
MKLWHLLWAAILVVELSLVTRAGDRRDSHKLPTRNTRILLRMAITPGGQFRVTKSGVVTTGEGWGMNSWIKPVGGAEGHKDTVTATGEGTLLKMKNSGNKHPLKGYGMFNTDMHSCDGIFASSCTKPSDCDGCLGLFNCQIPQGKCNLKSVTRRPAQFLDSLQIVLEDNMEKR